MISVLNDLVTDLCNFGNESKAHLGCSYQHAAPEAPHYVRGPSLFFNPIQSKWLPGSPMKPPTSFM